MFYVYIIKSLRQDRYYTGSTENLDKRLKGHNAGKVRSTKAYRPWGVVFTESYQTKKEALIRERQIKSYKSGEAFKRLIGKK